MRLRSCAESWSVTHAGICGRSGGACNELVLIDEALCSHPSSHLELVKLNETLERLTRLDPQQGQDRRTAILGRINRETDG
jgi:hypothetical protein